MTLITFSTSQISAIRIAFEAIDSLVADVNFEFSRDGIIIRDLDKSGNMLISATMGADKFDTYTYDCPSEKYNLGICVETIVKAVKCNLEYDVITFKVQSSNGTIPLVSVSLTSRARNEVKTCWIKTAQVLMNPNGIKELEYDIKLTMEPTMLTKYIKDINHMCPTVCITADKDKLQFIGYVENEMVLTQAILKGKMLEIICDENTMEVSRKLNSKDLLLLNKCSCLSETVSLYLSNSTPLLIEFPLASLGTLKLVYIRR